MWTLSRRALHALVPLLALLFACGTASADIKTEKPFAEAKVALQISDSDPFKQTLVLNVANNLLKHYGTDKVDIEIVAFGPGLRLLFDDNENKGRIESLVGQGVRFSACSNTVRAMSKILDHEPVLNSHATRVPAGIVRIMELTDAGYTLVKP